MLPLHATPCRIPRVIHQTARTRDLSWEERRLALRLQRQLPNWRYELWTDEDNLYLITKYFRWLLPTYMALQGPILQADLMRNVYMYLYGGLVFLVPTVLYSGENSQGSLG